MGSEDDKKPGIERLDKDKQEHSTTIQARRHSSDQANKQCASLQGDRCKSQRSLSRHQISNDSSSDPSSSDSGSLSSSSSGGDCKRAKNKTKLYERKPHQTRSAPVKTKVYKRKQCSSSSLESSEASEVEQVMMTRCSDIQLRDVNPQGREEWLTRVFDVTFHIVPKAVFNQLGATFTDRYKLASIIAFQARRLRAEDTHVISRTTVMSDSTTNELTLDEARLLAIQFDHGLPAFPEPRVTLNQARLDAIWRKYPHISDSEHNFKQGPRMLFLQTLELNLM